MNDDMTMVQYDFSTLVLHPCSGHRYFLSSTVTSVVPYVDGSVLSWLILCCVISSNLFNKIVNDKLQLMQLGLSSYKIVQT